MSILTSKFLAYIIRTSCSNKYSKTHNDKMTILSQKSPTFLDQLYCKETCWNDDDDDEKEKGDDCCSFEDEENHIVALFCKEKRTQFSEGVDVFDNSKLQMEARRGVLEWMIRVCAHHSFATVTLVLAVNYFDRFILRVGFQRERPWMTQLSALACLSLASKIQETHSPNLLELQVGCKYILEPKTIQRMELLVLSKLEWRMNSVTPLSYFGHLVKRFKLMNHLHWEILCRCEALILSAISDPRIIYYAPSVVATATMVQTLKEFGLWNPIEHEIHLVDAFKVNKDKIEECYKFIQEISNNDKAKKRKWCDSGDSSPKTVLDVVFSESSKESSVSWLSLPEPLPKKCKTIEFRC